MLISLTEEPVGFGVYSGARWAYIAADSRWRAYLVTNEKAKLSFEKNKGCSFAEMRENRFLVKVIPKK